MGFNSTLGLKALAAATGFVLAGATVVEAGDPIRKIFGVELGTTVDLYQVLGAPVSEKNFFDVVEWRQRVSPPTPNSIFDVYEVLYTPDSKQIYTIGAYAIMDLDACKVAIKDLSQTLKEKYKGYEVLETETSFAINDYSSMLIPSYQVQCFGEKLQMFLFDENLQQKHNAQYLGKSVIKKDGL